MREILGVPGTHQTAPEVTPLHHNISPPLSLSPPTLT